MIRLVLAVLIAASTSVAIAGPALALEATAAVQVPSSCAPAVALANGGFEDPVISGVEIRDESTVPGWSTTASDGAIEMWASDTGTAPGTGNQFVELNANEVSTLYQDLATVPGQVLRWQLQHRGRDGDDVMDVALGPPGSPGVQQGGFISDGNVDWGTYSGLYTVPAGQTVTRFAFESISSVGGDSYGNFLDSISLGTAACVVLSKSVANVSRPANAPAVGDVLEYTVTASNDGGVPAAVAVITDQAPSGTTYVAGSMSDATGALTDSAGDDTGENTAGALTWRVGDGADMSTGGSIPAGESRTASFRVTVDAGTVGQDLVNDAAISYVESLSGAPTASTSNTTITTVGGTADLQVTQTLDTALVSGGAFQYTITVTDYGPQASTGTHLTIVLPPFTNMSALDPDCQAVIGGQFDCDFGTLAQGASRIVLLTGTVPATAAGGSSPQLVSVVSGTSYDPFPMNNTATTTGLIPIVASIGVNMTIWNTDATGPGAPAYQGDELRGRYAVTNTGNVGVTSISVSDPFFGPTTCTPTLLAPGATASCVSDTKYGVTSNDVTAGSVASAGTALANSTGPGTPTVTDVSAAAIATGVRPAATAAVLGLTGSSPVTTLALGMLLLLVGAFTLWGRRLTFRAR